MNAYDCAICGTEIVVVGPAKTETHNAQGVKYAKPFPVGYCPKCAEEVELVNKREYL